MSAARLKFKFKLKRAALGLSALALAALLLLLPRRESLPPPPQQQQQQQQQRAASSQEPAEEQGEVEVLAGGLRWRPFESALALTRVELEQMAQQARFRALLAPNSRKLLNLNNLSYLREPNGRSNAIECEQGRRTNKRAPARTLLIVINSSAENFKRRERLRASWLNGAQIKRQLCGDDDHDHDEAAGRRAAESAAINHGARHKSSANSLAARTGITRVEFAFVLAKLDDAPARLAIASQRVGARHQAANASLSERSNRAANGELAREAAAHGDLLVVNLREHYHNMTLKHLALFKWLLGRRSLESAAAVAAASNSTQTLVLKCDDDAQLDLRQWLERVALETAALERESAPAAAARKALLMCAQFPPNSRVQRPADGSNAGGGRSKWRLSRREWPFDTFPAYCSGLAYLSSLALIERLYLAAHKLHELRPRAAPLWIDDVYVTGVLLAALEPSQFKLIRLNASFCYTRAQRERRRRELNARCMAEEAGEEHDD